MSECMKTLLLDVETAPKRAYVWGMWKQNIAPCQMISDWYMLTWAAKWLDKKRVLGETLIQHDRPWNDHDGPLLDSLWNLMDEADVIIAHNGDRFDVPSINTRFLMNGMPPPSPYSTIDTLKVARKEFKFTSNRLDYLGDTLGVGRKEDTGGFDLWSRCMDGDPKAFKHMLKYNKQDVLLLEQVYLKLRPYIKSPPNFGAFTDVSVCPTCGSDDLHKRGVYFTKTAKYHRYQCNFCGSWARARYNTRTKEEMKSTLIGC